MSKLRNIVLLLALLAVTSLVSFRLGERQNGGVTSDGGNQPFNLSTMWVVRDKLRQTFLEKATMNDKTMTYGAIQGMVASLGDPYTMYLPPTENKSANEDLAGKFGGVGISLGFKGTSLAVMSALPKTPAEKAGVMSGDLILKITDKAKNVDKDTTGLSLTEAVNLIRGKVGTEVTLKMFREGKGNTFDIVLKRDNIIVPSIELEWVDSKNTAITNNNLLGNKKVAWIKLYKFSDVLYKEWSTTVNQINLEKSKGNVAGIVLDLRNNPGGFLEASVMVASDFLRGGVVVSQQSSNGSKQDYKVDASLGRLLDDNLVVLVNGGSASASEILAGALKSYKRAKLVGEKTFGKGTVQQPEDLPDGSGLHITVAKWLLPDGKNIHKVGVEPDVTVTYISPVVSGTPTPTPVGSKIELKDNQLEKAIEVLAKG